MMYQQLEVMRHRALELGLACEWLGERHEDEAWLRVADGEHGIVMCWFPGRRPILSVEAQTHAPLEVAHAALELVALHATLTAGLAPAVADVPSPTAQRLFEMVLGIPGISEVSL